MPSVSASNDMPLLAMRGITKVFPGVRALDAVDFTLRVGEIHALLGQNGAGKSTLIKVLTGVHRHDAGEILLAGQPIYPRSPQHAQSLGISTVYQEINLIPFLSVAENILLGRQPRRWGRIDWKRTNQMAREALSRLELPLDVTRPLNTFSIAIQQMVAIARALDIAARVLILDEPTSSLDAREVAELFGVMHRLRERGLGIIFITHFLDQVYEIADRLTVLRNGALVGEYAVGELPPVELVTKMIGAEAGSGRTPGRPSPPRGPEGPEPHSRGVGAPAAGPPLLRATGLGRRGALNPLDLCIGRGEVVGLAGLLGSGRTETARLLFGIDRASSGRVEIDGRPIRGGGLRSPRAAIRHGLGFCPEDRKTEGLVPQLSVRENIVLALQARTGWRRLAPRTQRRLAQQYVESLRIVSPSRAASDLRVRRELERPVSELSGGTQQKVILARWLASQPRLLILDEPTRGIDVGAKAEVERLVAQLRDQGLAILFISSELEEVVRDCQRVVVLRERNKVGELSGGDINLTAVLRMIAG